jgi:protein-S-isoprenylcysteine O-methyltransferase Ste14
MCLLRLAAILRALVIIPLYVVVAPWLLAAPPWRIWADPPGAAGLIVYAAWMIFEQAWTIGRLGTWKLFRVEWLSCFALSLTQTLAYAIMLFDYGHPSLPPVSPLRWVGVGLVAGGMAMRVVAVRTLGRWYQARPTVLEGQRLVKSGLYGVLRHPGYTGAIIGLSGLALAFRAWVGLAAVALLVVPGFLIRIAREEQVLLSAFGDEYRQYRQHTWRLIPYVY